MSSGKPKRSFFQTAATVTKSVKSAAKKTVVAGLAVSAAAGAYDGERRADQYVKDYETRHGAFTGEAVIGAPIIGGIKAATGVHEDGEHLLRRLHRGLTGSDSGLGSEIVTAPFRAVADAGGLIAGAVTAGFEASASRPHPVAQADQAARLSKT